MDTQGRLELQFHVTNSIMGVESNTKGVGSVVRSNPDIFHQRIKQQLHRYHSDRFQTYKHIQKETGI